MDVIALKIVYDHIKRTKNISTYAIFIAWKAKILQNWKYMIATDAGDGMYYELTYNGNNHEWYLDIYKKQENIVIKDEDLQK